MATSPVGTGSVAKKLVLPSAITVVAASAVALMVHNRTPSGAARLGATGSAPRVVVSTRSYDLGRTGWNQNETVLSPATVTPQTFHKIAEIRVVDPADPTDTNEKIEASPLYVAGAATPSGPRDLLIVATTQNKVYAFDATTGTMIWRRALGMPPDELAGKTWVYKWGITATPVIDADAGIVYVVRDAVESGNKVYRLYGLGLGDGTDAVASQAVNGFSVKLNDSKFFVDGQQIIRTALTLWRNSTGDKAVIFGASGGEGGGPSGWVIAYNVARLAAGGNVTPAIWCSTPDDGGAGIWMASQGVAVDESDPARDIYIATGNGPYKQQFGHDSLGESVVRLRYTPSANTLYTVDWFTAFKDADHDANHKDQDLGAAGVLLIPGARTVLAGGKEGIFYNVDRTNMGKLLHSSLLQPDFVGTFTPTAGWDYLANTNQATTTDGVTGGSGDGRTFIPHPADGGRTHHVHGSAVYFENGAQRLVYVMGENATLRAFAYDGTKLGTTPIAQSSPITIASGPIPPPGGMPGGFLSVSSADAAGTGGIVWSISPRKSAWRDPVAGVIPALSILRAFTAAPAADGTMTELWNSELDVGDAVGSASKFQPPLVADGKVYVATYDNKVDVYGITPPTQLARDIRRTMVLIKAHLAPGQDLFLRGGVDQAYGNTHGRSCPTSAPPPGDSRYYNCAVRIEHRNPLNYGASHEPYPITNRWQVYDAYLDWYGAEELQIYQRLDANGHGLGLAQGTPLDWTTSDPSNAGDVVRTGYGFLKENTDAGLGADYWMLDVDMDCESAVTVGGTAWFEFKSYLPSSGNPWEVDVTQADRPYVSSNHFGKCGKINIYERGKSTVTYRDFDTVNDCAYAGEKRCNAGHSQLCQSHSGALHWQDTQDCVESHQLCQVSTGVCCTPTNGFAGANANCY